jgi:hypothetical protein
MGGAVKKPMMYAKGGAVKKAVKSPVKKAKK